MSTPTLTLSLSDRKNIIHSQCMGNSQYRRQHYIAYHGYKYSLPSVAGFIRQSGDYYLFPPPEISGGQGSERFNPALTSTLGRRNPSVLSMDWDVQSLVYDRYRTSFGVLTATVNTSVCSTHSSSRASFVSLAAPASSQPQSSCIATESTPSIKLPVISYTHP